MQNVMHLKRASDGPSLKHQLLTGLFVILLLGAGHTTGFASDTKPAPATVMNGVEPSVQQGIIITGTVIDTNGDALPGVNISVKGTTTGIMSDSDGRFSLTIPNRDVTLQFSYIGYATQEMKVGNLNTLNVTLQESSQELEEVVVVGYGTMKKRDMVGSVSKVAGSSITKMPVASFSQSLQGMASGLYIGNLSGHPGRSTDVLIRGKNSINLGTGPLWIIDGMAIGEGSGEMTVNGVKAVSANSMINPNDIESIEVLKDAAATAIYGNRAAGGVIIITTKSNKGKASGLSVNYDGGVSWLPLKQSDLFVDSGVWWNMVDKAWANAGNSTDLQPNTITNVTFGDSHKPNTTKEEARRTNTDWMDAISQNAMYHQFDVTANKGFDTGGVMFSLNYRNEESVMKNNGIERVSGRFSFNYTPLKSLYIGINASLQYIKNKGVISGDGKGAHAGGWLSIFFTPPWYKIYDESHATGYWHPNSGYNAVASTDPALARNESDILRSINNATLKWDTPLKGLSVNGEVGVTMMLSNSSWWRSIYLSNEPYASSAGELSRTGYSWTYTAFLNYNRTFGKHNIDVTTGTEILKGSDYTRRAEGREIYSSYPELINPITRTLASGISGYSAPMLGYFGRANYKFNERYLLNFSVRRDGHGALSKENRWATFWAFGPGWIISEEEFFNLPVLSLLKIRGSFGTTGNSGISRSMTRMTWGLDSGANYGVDYIPGITTLGPMGNSGLKWETSTNTDVGLDFGILQNRISGSVAYYLQRISDLILRGNVQPSTGFNNNEVWENVGDMKNWGWEFNITSNNLNRQFRWTTDFNISFNRNKILKLNQIESGKGKEDNTEIRKEGEMLNTWYLATSAGVDPQKGIFMIQQRDATKWDTDFVTESTGNLIPATSNNVVNNRMVQSGKTPMPTFYGGLTNTFSYKRFDMSILLTFSGGNYLKSHLYNNNVLILDGFPYLKEMDGNYWEKPGDVKKFPMLAYQGYYKYDNAGNPSNTGVEYKSTSTTFYLSKADHMRIRNIQLGYTFPNEVSKKIGLSNVRIYAGASNLYTFTKFEGVDPETNGDLPIPRMFNFGLSINL